MSKKILITGTSKGIGRYLAEYFLNNGNYVIGCSRSVSDLKNNYKHYSLSVNDELKVKRMFSEIRSMHGSIDVLINNAEIASMNHSLLTGIEPLRKY